MIIRVHLHEPVFARNTGDIQTADRQTDDRQTDRRQTARQSNSTMLERVKNVKNITDKKNIL